ncbi:DNA cytosine methyltransferase [Hungateiclostridiaceae bacterium KB18]
MIIRFFDMFAGIGGFRSGLEAVGGFECVGHCEIDKYANQAWRVLACHSYYCQGTKAIAVYGAQGIAGFEESRTVRHGAALPNKGRQKQFAFSTEEDMTENTCRQGGTILSRWQVPPVMVAGVGNYPIEEWNTAERIGKLTR